LSDQSPAQVMFNGFIIQDTVRQKNISLQDTIKQISDSSVKKIVITGDSIRPVKTLRFNPVIKNDTTDTTSVSYRNSIADVTFHDSANFIIRMDERDLQNFPFVFTGINRKAKEETKTDLVKHLKGGNELPQALFHDDWILPVILFTVFIYGIIKAESIKFVKGILKFVSLRGINESASRDIGTLYQWQSSLLNLASFLNISLFAFLSSVWYGLLPSAGNHIIFWLIILVIIISGITIRHFACFITGTLSGEWEIFNEYLVGIYQSYRLAGLLLLIISVLIIYTTFVPVKILFYSGFFLSAILYFIRIFRLFLIFINRHDSIFYLILYLCALEILPVVIIVKYITGLV
jgi:magnesium-transporting ATPase (P-type)